MQWLNNPLVRSLIGGYLRHTLTVLAGALVAKGAISNDQATQAVGALMVFGAIAWSGVQKLQQHRTLATTQAALVEARNATVNPTDASMAPIPNP